MAYSSPSPLDECRREEDNISRLVADAVLKPRQLDDALNRHRDIVSSVLLTDFEYATSNAFLARNRLWDNHQKVNTKFRSDLANLRESSEQKPVELRKLRQEYLKFIKGASTFYRTFIKRLSKAYGGIPSLENVAKQLKPDVEPSSRKPSNQYHDVAKIELCCHWVLIHLGDLSRYREVELAGPEKNWGPACGYYDLALRICPMSGIPYNQRAVIALADKAIFRAVYYVYRSISASEPQPQGEQQLRRALHKIQQAWNNKELTVDPLATAGAALPKGMVAWYLRLIEMFFHGRTGLEREELEREVITQLKVDIRQNPLSESPRKLVLTGIAAQHAAQERFEAKQLTSHQNAYLLFLQLNLQIFMALLSVFATEAEELPTQSSVHSPTTHTVTLSVTPVLQRVLPALRLYGLWLERTSNIIDSPASGLSDALKTEFWAAYAKALSVMMVRFPPEVLPTVAHLLEEDEDTLGFKPLFSLKNNSVWYQQEQMRQKWHDITENDREVEKEMQFRIQEFTVQGLDLTLTKRVPLIFDNTSCVFTYKAESGFQLPSPPSPQVISTALSDSNPHDQKNGDDTVISEDTGIVPEQEDAAQDQEAERMVNNIVGGKGEVVASTVPNGEAPTNGNHPMTPLHESSGGNGDTRVVSSLATGPQTVGDIVAATYKHSKPVSPTAQSFERQSSRSGSRPNSSAHSPALPQQQLRYSTDFSLGGSQGIPRTQYTYPEDPALPGLGVIKNKPARTPLLSPSSPQPARSSPLPPPASHSRGTSRESSHGIWGGGIFDPSSYPSEGYQDLNETYSGQSNPGTTSSRIPDTLPRGIRGSPATHNFSNFPQDYTLPRNHNASQGSPIANTHAFDMNDPAAEIGSSRNLNYGNVTDPWATPNGRRFTEWHQT